MHVPSTPPPPPESKRAHIVRFLLGAAKSGAVGALLGGLCAVLPEHLTAARVVCRFAAHFLGGG